MTISSLIYNFNHAQVWRANVNVFGGRFNAPSLDRYIYLWLHRLGLMGKEDQELLPLLVKPGMRVVDVGANVGLYSFLLSTLVGSQGAITAFEPEPELFKALKKNCEGNNIRSIKLFEYAIGEANGSIVFQRSPLNSGDNRIGNSNKKRDGIEVKLARLDDVLENGQVDFIKIDVQGYELGVFKGMDKLLSSNPSLIIYFEFWPDGIRKAHSDPMETLNYLKSYGFEIYQSQKGSIKKVTDFNGLLNTLPRSCFANLIASKSPCFQD